MQNEILGRELLRLHQATARREGEVVVRTSMRSQYEPGDNRSALIRSGVLDVIDAPAVAGLGAYGTLGAVGLPGAAEVNRTLASNAGVRRAIDMLPPPFTSAQKTRLKRAPLTFIEEYIQANKNLVVSIIRGARQKKSFPRAVAIDDMIARKRHTYRVDVSTRSSWQDVLVAAIAMSNKYPGEMALSTVEVTSRMAAGAAANIVQNITSMFSGLGEPATATAAGGTAATITAVTGLIAAIATLAGVILPVLTGLTGDSVPAAPVENRTPAAPAKKRSATQPTKPAAQTYQPPVAKKSNLPLIIAGGAVLGAGAFLLAKRK